MYLQSNYTFDSSFQNFSEISKQKYPLVLDPAAQREIYSKLWQAFLYEGDFDIWEESKIRFALVKWDDSVFQQMKVISFFSGTLEDSRQYLFTSKNPGSNSSHTSHLLRKIKCCSNILYTIYNTKKWTERVTKYSLEVYDVIGNVAIQANKNHDSWRSYHVVSYPN